MVPKAVERHRGKRKGKKERRRIEEAVQYALAHHTRLEILILLNEAAYTTSEVAALAVVPQDVPNATDRRAIADRAVASGVVVVVEPVWQRLRPVP